MQRISRKRKERIANNIIAFMNDNTPLSREAISFIRNWVKLYDGIGNSEGYHAVWEIVLTNYLPKERPILFRSCVRISNRKVQSFTGRIRVAEKFSEKHKGHLLICDTEEYLQYENEKAVGYQKSYFPLFKCVEKAMLCDPPCFSEAFYEDCKKEDEYIVLVNQSWLYDLKWNKNS